MAATSESLGRHDDFGVLDIPLGREHGLQLRLTDSLHKASLTQSGFSPVGDDLPQEPAKVLHRFIPVGKDVDRVLQRHRPHALQPAPHLDPEIVRLGRDLVDQEQPARLDSLS